MSQTDSRPTRWSLAEEFAGRYRGRAPSLTEYATRFPSWPSGSAASSPRWLRWRRSARTRAAAPGRTDRSGRPLRGNWASTGSSARSVAAAWGSHEALQESLGRARRVEGGSRSTA